MRGSWRVVVAVVLLGAALPAEAQRRCVRSRDGRVVRCEDRDDDRGHGRRYNPVELGVRAGYDFDAEGGTFGGHLRVPVVGPVVFLPSLETSFEDVPTHWQANGDLVLRTSWLAGVYGGAGVGFVHREDDEGDGHETVAGLNLLLGLDGARFSGTTLRPFVEGRWTLTDEDRDAFRLSAGFNVSVTGH